MTGLLWCSKAFFFFSANKRNWLIKRSVINTFKYCYHERQELRFFFFWKVYNVFDNRSDVRRYARYKMNQQPFHVWTLSGLLPPSACLPTLLLNTYRCDKTGLNTRADKDEKHERHILFHLSVSNWELFSASVDWRNLKMAWSDDQSSTVQVLIKVCSLLPAVEILEISKKSLFLTIKIS